MSHTDCPTPLHPDSPHAAASNTAATLFAFFVRRRTGTRTSLKGDKKLNTDQ
ncbi:hypothetical protein D3C75_1133020 [compost metagenome]|jgi:hypothetical protein